MKCKHSLKGNPSTCSMCLNVPSTSALQDLFFFKNRKSDGFLKTIDELDNRFLKKRKRLK